MLGKAQAHTKWFEVDNYVHGDLRGVRRIKPNTSSANADGLRKWILEHPTG